MEGKGFLITNLITIKMLKQYETVFIATPVLSEEQIFEFRADSQFIDKLETQYRRDERIIRFLTFVMDKDSIAYSERRRANRKESANTAKEE